MNFESHSQAGQDRFVWQLLGPGPGRFLDIGANHPVEKSNTYALEQMGWDGACVENDAHCIGLLCRQRSAFIVPADATAIDWKTYSAECHEIGKQFDYLSLDVDEASLTVLKNVLESGIRFKALTVEHDAYRFGETRRDEMVKILEEHGYFVLCKDVCDQGLSFEIWAFNPSTDLPVRVRAEQFRKDAPTDWKEFFA